MVRASIAVDAEIAESLSKFAQTKHMTLYSLTNQILKTWIDLMKEGIQLEDVKALLTAHQILKDFDSVVLPSEFVDSLITDLYSVDREKTLQHFRQLGRDVGKYLKVYADNLSALFELVRSVGKFFPLKRLEVRLETVGRYEVAVLGIGGRIESTACVFEAIKGILEEFGYTTTDETITKGLAKFTIIHK